MASLFKGESFQTCHLNEDEHHGIKRGGKKEEIHSREQKDSPFRVFQGMCVSLVDTAF